MIEIVEETGSTNVDLVERARSDPATPMVRFAEYQTAGRGRRDRTWVAPPASGLAVSFLVPWTDPTNVPGVPMALGLAACAAIDASGAAVRLKWPNDLVDASDRKVGGMLSEVVLDGRRPGAVVCGLGLNVSWPTAVDDDAPPSASCLDEIAGTPVDRSSLATGVVAEMEQKLQQLTRLGQRNLVDQQRRRSATIGRLVRIESTSAVLEGVATDIDESGALVVDIDGRQQRIDVGDVVHLRPRQSESGR